MADLFTVTSPLLIRYRDGRRHVMVERFRHPRGLLYFRTFWNRLPPIQGMGLVEGEVCGDGPWKIGTAVITVLGCHGADPEEAAEFASWQDTLQQLGSEYPDREHMQEIARAAGYLP